MKPPLNAGIYRLSLPTWLAVFSCLFSFLVKGHAQEEKLKGAYYLVIDRSGSMRSKIEAGELKGKTRWEAMKERARSFVRRLPEGSDVWIVVFDSVMPEAEAAKIARKADDWAKYLSVKELNEKSKSKLLTQIDSLSAPKGPMGTALYDAKGKALEMIKGHGKNDYATVLIYTDGVDQPYGGGAGKLGSREETANSVNTQASNLKKKFRNFTFLDVYQPKQDLIKDAYVVRLEKNRFLLQNPLNVPEQVIELPIHFLEDSRFPIEGKEMKVKVVPPKGVPTSPVRVINKPIICRNGKVEVILGLKDKDLFNSLKVKSLQLELAYPDLGEEKLIITEGGNRVLCTFADLERPEVRELFPRDKTVVQLGREVEFGVHTVGDEEAVWKFIDDGSVLKGDSVKKKFMSRGVKRVAVFVENKKTGVKSDTKEFSIEVQDYSIELLSKGKYSTGDEGVFQAVSKGKIMSFSWFIDGGLQKIEGDKLEYKFPKAGTYLIEVRGEVKDWEYDPPKKSIRVVVSPRPRFQVASPQPGLIIPLRKGDCSVECRVVGEGIENLNKLRITLDDAGEKEIFFSEFVGGELEEKVAQRTISFNSDILESREVSLTFEALDRGGNILIMGGKKLSQTSAVNLQIVKPKPKLTVEPSNRVVRINSSLSAKVEDENGFVIKQRKWTLKEVGSGKVVDSSTNSLFVTKLRSYGRYSLECEVYVEGVKSPSLCDYEVVVEPVEIVAKGSITFGGTDLGNGRGKVPLGNAVKLENLSVGDIDSFQWIYNGKVMDSGIESVVLDTPGRHTIELKVFGPKEAGGERKWSVVIATSNRLIVYAAIVGTLLILFVFGKICLRNGGLNAAVNAAPTSSPLKTPRGGYTLMTGFNIWTKVFTVRLHDVDPKGGWNHDRYSLKIRRKLKGFELRKGKAWDRTGRKLLMELYRGKYYSNSPLRRPDIRHSQRRITIWIDPESRKSMWIPLLYLVYALIIPLSFYVFYKIYNLFW